MHIEQELTEYLNSVIPSKRSNRRRDIEAVLLYYGFGRLAWPTLDEIGQQLDIGSGESVRERVRQVVNESFRKIVKLDQLPVAAEIFDIIQSYQCVSVPEIKAQLLQLGIASENTTIRGMLNLARDFQACKGYKICDISLEKIPRFIGELDGKTFLVQEKTLTKLIKDLKVAMTLPGRIGLAKFEDLSSKLGYELETSYLMPFLREAPNICVVMDDTKEWYMFENRENTVVNQCEKIYGITDRLRVPVLAVALRNSLKRNKPEYDSPTAELLGDWIEKSKLFLVESEVAKFQGVTDELTKIENDAVNYLKGRNFSTYTDLKEHLIALGHGADNAGQVINNSALVAIDKTAGKRNYRYQLIAKAGEVEEGLTTEVSRYESFKNRLKKFLFDGTDSTAEVTVRREQMILKEWLLGSEKVFPCAICGQAFSVGALVAAHKKKRASCIDSERVDPNIVFPLCKFGCDYLYEKGELRIVNGVVQTSEQLDINTSDGKRASELKGTQIDQKWLSGSDSYFRDHSINARTFKPKSS